MAESDATDRKTEPGASGSDPAAELLGSVPAPAGTMSRPCVKLDVALYEEYLSDWDLSDEEKIEFLQALWSIIVAFVDLGFGIHPVQQAMGADAGENSGSDKIRALSPDDVITSLHKGPTTRFEEAAGRQHNGRADR